MKLLKYIFILLSIFVSNVFASPLDSFINSFTEQEQSIEWVISNARIDLNPFKASLIVREVYAYAYSQQLNPQLLLAIMRTESGFISNAKSRYGATGLMQVVPRYHREKLQKRNPNKESVSIEVGVQILKDCFNKFNDNKYKSLNCYSGGGGNKYSTTVNNYQKSLTAFIKESNNKSIQLAFN